MFSNPGFLLAVVQAVIIVLLTIDRWVHRVTGKQSLESRLGEVEKRLESASETFSEKWGLIQKGMGDIQICQREQEQHLKYTDREVVDLRARINNFHGAP